MKKIQYQFKKASYNNKYESITVSRLNSHPGLKFLSPDPKTNNNNITPIPQNRGSLTQPLNTKIKFIQNSPNHSTITPNPNPCRQDPKIV